MTGYSLLVGGVRSGKSRLAVDLGRRSGRPVTFVATAEAGDDDMARRIDAHRDERPEGWTTIEAPHDLAGALALASPDDFVIVDCLTVWAANLLLAGNPDVTVIEQARAVAGRLADHPGGAVVVTNEVGMGVHPSSDLGRHYRDLLGTVNVAFGDRARTAALIVAGRALPLLPVAELFA